MKKENKYKTLFELKVISRKYRGEDFSKATILSSPLQEDYLYLKTLIDELIALIKKESNIPENASLRKILKNPNLVRPHGKRGFSIEFNSFSVFLLIAISREEFVKEWPIFNTIFQMNQDAESYFQERTKHKEYIKSLKN